MSDLKKLRSRVKSIKATQKITKAMQMVAASKLKKIRDKIQDSEHYLQALRDMMSQIASNPDIKQKEMIFFDQEAYMIKPHLLIILTSERGLCGSFNAAIIKKVKSDIETLEKEGKNFQIMVVGKKGYEALKGKYLPNISDYFIPTKENEKIIPIEIRQQILNLITTGQIGSCSLYFSQFKNALTQVPSKQQIFPIEKMKVKEGEIYNSTYEFEGRGIIENTINLYLTGQINYSILQNKAGEEGARMSAMDNATKNAGEIIEGLTLKLNRTRQAVITKELIEIISGAEAV